MHRKSIVNRFLIYLNKSKREGGGGESEASREIHTCIKMEHISMHTAYTQGYIQDRGYKIKRVSIQSIGCGKLSGYTESS